MLGMGQTLGQTFGQGMQRFGGGGRLGHGYFGAGGYPAGGFHGGGFLHLIPALFVIGLLVLLAVMVIRWHRHNNAAGCCSPVYNGNTKENPLDILKERYARGDIDTTGYEERKKALLA